MHGVVPSKEWLAVGACVLDATEALGEVRSVLQRLELRLRERVVVRDVGPAVALGDIQIDQQRGHGLGAHAGAAVGMQREHPALDIMAGHGLGDELLGQVGALALSDEPAHDVAAEDVQDHVEVEAHPLGRTFELGDVPRPNLIGLNSQQLGLGVGRVGELVAPLAATTVDGQQAVHRAHRAEIAALVEQRGVHRRRGGVDEALAVEGVEQQLALRNIQRQWWAHAGSAPWPWAHKRRPTQARPMPGRCAPPQAQRAARGAGSQGRGEFVHAAHELLSGLLSCSSRANKAATFF